jgi:hypothetical protein
VPRELVLPGQSEALAPHGQQEDRVGRVDLEQAADAPDVAHEAHPVVAHPAVVDHVGQLPHGDHCAGRPVMP